MEERFLVVHWTQRGALKSFSAAIPPESMRVGQFVADLEKLARYLLKRFGQRKLFLAGQSWGSLLCMRMVQRCPELVHAYVGVNQIIDQAQEELTSYRYALTESRRRGHKRFVVQLETIGEPVGGIYTTLEGTLTHKTVTRSLGLVTHDPGTFTAFARAMFLNPELTLGDIINMFRGLRWNMELLWKEFCQGNLFTEIPAVGAPVYFVAGRHDTITSADLAAQYLEQVRAPHKELLFEHSG